MGPRSISDLVSLWHWMQRHPTHMSSLPQNVTAPCRDSGPANLWLCWAAVLLTRKRNTPCQGHESYGPCDCLAGQQQAQRSSTEEERRPRSSMEEEKGSTSSSGSMLSCRTHASSSTDDVTKVREPSPGAQTISVVGLPFCSL